MPKSKPITAGKLYFKRKKDAEKYFSDILNKYDMLETLSEKDAEEVPDLLKLHPEAGEKIGNGVDHIYVDLSKEGTPCFWLERKEGNIDFSLYKVIRKYKI